MIHSVKLPGKQTILTCMPFALALLFLLPEAGAQDTVTYTGKTLSNVDYHHGQLSPAMGVHNMQLLRANREYPETSDGYGWTYNHGPTMAYWNDKFYIEYLSNPIGEHVPPGQSFLITSEDGVHWSKPTTLFPIYPIADGTTKEGHPGVAKDLDAVMHQRMGFFVSDDDRLLSLAYYGICLDHKDKPNDGKGIGRVVREIYRDGTLGPIYFIRYNSGYDEKNTLYPFYKNSDDKGFVKACDELLGEPLMMQQWVEEADRDDPLIPLKEQYKAFSYYHLPDGRVVGLWKHALTSISKDGGRSWEYNPIRAPGFVNSNAKIWGQRTSDGRYATIYNPSEFRWPLAISVSDDGLEYKNLLLVNGEITAMRYGGNYKSYGPQYVRGILEGNGAPPDGNLWVTYSMNKEDIWVAKIPVPATGEATEPFNDVFDEMPDGEELAKYNLYRPIWAPSRIEEKDGVKMLAMKDWDPFDYAKVERLFPESKSGVVEFSIIPGQNDKGLMHIELQDGESAAALRLIFDADSVLKTKAGYRLSGMTRYEPDTQYDIRIEFDTKTRSYKVFVNGEQETHRVFFAPVHTLSRVVFRTGEVRRFPNADTPTDQDYDLPDGGETEPRAEFYIRSLKVDRLQR